LKQFNFKRKKKRIVRKLTGCSCFCGGANGFTHSPASACELDPDEAFPIVNAPSSFSRTIVTFFPALSPFRHSSTAFWNASLSAASSNISSSAPLID
jgi:hypothetical protein